MAVGLVETAELLEQLRVDVELRERFRELFRGDGDPLDLLERREAGVELVDGLYELKLAAYSRHANPADEARAAAALVAARERAAELSRELDAALATISEPPPPPPQPTAPKYRLPRGVRPLVAAATVVTLLTAVGLTVRAPTEPPIDSLVVFNRPPTAVELPSNAWAAAAAQRVPGTVADVRLLGAAEQIDIYAYRDPQYGVCLATVDPGLVTSGACATPSEFRASGVFLEVSHNSGSAGKYLSVFWGPTGGVRSYPMPASAVFSAGLESPRKAPVWPT